MLNNRLKDQQFLEVCFREEVAALDRWLVDSYFMEVAEAIKEGFYRHATGRIDRVFLEQMIVDCTSAIYEQHATLPSGVFQLKTVVRRFAFSYIRRYLRTPGRRLSADP